MRNIAIPLGLSVILILAAFNTVELREFRVNRIVIDPGHGGKDSGTLGAHTQEKNVALPIALQLKRILQEEMPEVEVILTRKTDSFPTLNDRADLANNLGADLFVSIHANWFQNPEVYGTETYVMGVQNSGRNFEVATRENSSILLEDNYEDNYEGFDPSKPESYILLSLTQSAHQERSLLLASQIEKQFKTRVGRKSRGVRQSSLYLLWRTTMPSVLVEVGYLSNPKEEKELNNELNQVYIASGIYRAFRDYKKEIESY